MCGLEFTIKLPAASPPAPRYWGERRLRNGRPLQEKLYKCDNQQRRKENKAIETSVEADVGFGFCFVINY